MSGLHLHTLLFFRSCSSLEQIWSKCLLSHKTSSMHSLVLLRVKLGDALVKCKKEDE